MSLIVGDVERLTARAYDSKGRTTNASFVWSSADPAVASVGKHDGIVYAASVGTTAITAATGTVSASATVTVRPPGPPASLSISATRLNLVVGWADRLTVRAYDATGRATNAAVEWSSADPRVASVDASSGSVTAVSAGATTVTASVGTVRTTATVSVVDIPGTITLTRRTNVGQTSFTSDVLVLSIRDRTMRSLPRAGTFTSIAAPAWSPDGTRLVMEVVHETVGNDEEHWTDYSSDLYVADVGAPSTSPWRQLTTNRQGRSPSWSPDGARIAFVQRQMLSASSHIYLMDAGGGSPLRLTITEGQYAQPRWSPDGKRLAFSNDAGRNREVFIINADGSGLINISQNAAFDDEPSWSPDGSSLVFVSNRDGNTSELFIVDSAGVNPRRVTTLGGWSSAPVWSPDGKYIAFAVGREDGAPSGIYLLNISDLTLLHLSSPPPTSWDAPAAWRR